MIRGEGGSTKKRHRQPTNGGWLKNRLRGQRRQVNLAGWEQAFSAAQETQMSEWKEGDEDESYNVISSHKFIYTYCLQLRGGSKSLNLREGERCVLALKTTKQCSDR